MDDANIGINDVTFARRGGSPSSFKGLFASRELAAITLHVRANNRTEIELVDNLLKEKKVTVRDPFAERSYAATIHLSVSSSIEGTASKSYVIEVKEVDTWPQFEFLEIDGIRFDPIQYKEEAGSSDGEIKRKFLLKLSRAEFEHLQRVRREDSVQFKRVGVDEDALDLRIGGLPFWSEHFDGDIKYFKQLMTLYPLREKEESKFPLASGDVQNNLGNAYVVLKIQFDLLVEELSASGVISKKKKELLFHAPLLDLVPEKRIDELVARLYQVTDVEKKF